MARKEDGAGSIFDLPHVRDRLDRVMQQRDAARQELAAVRNTVDTFVRAYEDWARADADGYDTLMEICGEFAVGWREGKHE